ncbi:hypothetical protein LNA76_07865 [Alcaligenes sp. MMA]|uniref:hypothetical protein n=1 Tax=Alcaligenes sp. MMA TaxID=2893019 RepID=UPI001E622255|nr:hypothetical protein [Alcaligenes sp. MMA]MCC9163245.1 hypothetical protein [Alcaligenes sp. MMA]
MFKKILKFFGLPSSVAPFPYLPQGMNEIGDYKVLLEQSVLFTRTLGFDTPEINWKNHDVLGADGDFIRKIGEAANIIDFSSSAGQCLKWCHYIRPYAEKILEVPVWLTIGQLWKSNKTVFNPSWEDFQKWSTLGISLPELRDQNRSGINLHAWLTVATGEIIEPTLMSSIAAVNPQIADSLRGAITWGKEPGFIKDHRYFPMVIGDAIAEAMHQKSSFPLLARCQTDLSEIPMFIELSTR